MKPTNYRLPKHWLWLVALASMLCVGVPPVQAQESATDKAQQFQTLLAKAQQGDVSSQINLAIAYVRGNGTQKDNVKAFEWMQRAASTDDATAQGNLERK